MVKNRLYGTLFLLTILALARSYPDEDTDTIVIDESLSISQGGADDSSSSAQVVTSDPCYDPLTGKAQRCIPNFENIAYNRRVKASSTCGSPPINYCLHNNGAGGSSSGGISSRSINKHMQCDKCDEKVNGSVRDAKYLTDLEETNSTCWVSGPVYEPGHISNLTLDISFGKKYELTYIRLALNYMKLSLLFYYMFYLLEFLIYLLTFENTEYIAIE